MTLGNRNSPGNFPCDNKIIKNSLSEKILGLTSDHILENILDFRDNISNIYCGKSVRILSYFSPYFLTFGLNSERHLFVFSLNAGKYGPE